MIYLSICGPTSLSASVVLLATSSYAYLLLILVILEYYLLVGNVLVRAHSRTCLYSSRSTSPRNHLLESTVCIEYYYYIKSSYYDARTLHNIPYPYYDS